MTAATASSRSCAYSPGLHGCLGHPLRAAAPGACIASAFYLFFALTTRGAAFTGGAGASLEMARGDSRRVAPGDGGLAPGLASTWWSIPRLQTATRWLTTFFAVAGGRRCLLARALRTWRERLTAQTDRPRLSGPARSGCHGAGRCWKRAGRTASPTCRCAAAGRAAPPAAWAGDVGRPHQRPAAPGRGARRTLAAHRRGCAKCGWPASCVPPATWGVTPLLRARAVRAAERLCGRRAGRRDPVRGPAALDHAVRAATAAQT